MGLRLKYHEAPHLSQDKYVYPQATPKQNQTLRELNKYNPVTNDMAQIRRFLQINRKYEENLYYYVAVTLGNSSRQDLP